MRSRPGRLGGFTLIELLIVMVIAGIALALVVVQATPNAASRLHDDGAKLAQLFALAQEEAQLRAQPVSWEGDTRGWRFVIAGGNQPPIILDDVLAPTTWSQPLDALTLTVSGNATPVRLVFGAEPIGAPFQLRLRRAGYAVTIDSDGTDHYRTSSADTPVALPTTTPQGLLFSRQSPLASERL